MIGTWSLNSEKRRRTIVHLMDKGYFPNARPQAEVFQEARGGLAPINRGNELKANMRIISFISYPPASYRAGCRFWPTGTIYLVRGLKGWSLVSAAAAGGFAAAARSG